MSNSSQITTLSLPTMFMTAEDWKKNIREDLESFSVSKRGKLIGSFMECIQLSFALKSPLILTQLMLFNLLEILLQS